MLQVQRPAQYCDLGAQPGQFRSFGDGGDFGTTGLDISERFVGQIITIGGPVGKSEILSGLPTDSLTLDGSFKSICSFSFPGANSIAGEIPQGQPGGPSCGEGSMAFVFDVDQSQIAIEFGGVNGGKPITLDFFQRDGDLIEQIVLTAR